jgi:cytoskeletal protein RodZ
MNPPPIQAGVFSKLTTMPVVDRQVIDFGAMLRDARERQGLSLRGIADATKISVRALESLERNDISQLPGGIFSRAFVRAYALEVGLDPEQTIAEFITHFPHESVTQGHPRTRSHTDGRAAPRRAVRRWVLGAAVLLAGAAALAHFGILARLLGP